MGFRSKERTKSLGFETGNQPKLWNSGTGNKPNLWDLGEDEPSLWNLGAQNKTKLQDLGTGNKPNLRDLGVGSETSRSERGVGFVLSPLFSLSPIPVIPHPPWGHSRGIIPLLPGWNSHLLESLFWDVSAGKFHESQKNPPPYSFFSRTGRVSPPAALQRAWAGLLINTAPGSLINAASQGSLPFVRRLRAVPGILPGMLWENVNPGFPKPPRAAAKFPKTLDSPSLRVQGQAGAVWDTGRWDWGDLSSRSPAPLELRDKQRFPRKAGKRG